MDMDMIPNIGKAVSIGFAKTSSRLIDKRESFHADPM
jgi:hypothetical protein